MTGFTGKISLLSTAAILMAAPTFYQGAAAQETDGEEGDLLSMDEIVVTGTASRGLKKSEVSFAITSLSSEDINKFSPKSTADLFKTTPGVWVESSGGESGANIFVRGFASNGDADFTTVQLNGMPVYPAPTLSFLENSSLFRLDETIERMEGLRGGPNPVFSNGQPGVTFNFIQKRGGETPEGLVKASISDYGMRRIDAVYGGPLAENWFISLGGFYRTSDGIRDTEFPADRGGQFSFNLTHDRDDGGFSLYGRYTNDKNAWLLPIPLIQEEDGSIKEFPGFDAGTGTYHGNDTRLAELEIGPGDGLNGPETVRRDLGDGRGPDIFILGGSYEKDFGNGWLLSEKFSYMEGDANTMGLVPATNPVSATEYLAGQIAIANDGGIVEGAAGSAATTGSFSFTSTGDPLTDLSQQVMSLGWWSVEKQLQAFSNDIRLSKEVAEGNTVTIGVYFTDYSSKDVWYLNRTQLVTAEPNSRRLDLVLDNGVMATQNGFDTPNFTFDVNAAYSGRNIAGFIADEWEVNEDLRIDAGLRVENQKVDATLENLSTGDLDGNPLTLHNNNVVFLNGTFRTIEFDKTEIAWTIGVNYFLTEEMSAFARINSGFKMPQFDNLREGFDQVQEVDQYELGYKLFMDKASVYATFFYNKFKGIAFQDVGVPSTSGDARTFGIELEAVVEPLEGLQLALNGTWQDSEFTDLGEDTGNQVQRQPEFQARFTPSYEMPLDFGLLTLYGTVSYVGDRFSDRANAQELPSYTKLDAGVLLDIGEGVTIQVVADNLTDTIGLTEGNPRALGSGVTGDGVILARPILGRSVKGSLTYRF